MTRSEASTQNDNTPIASTPPHALARTMTLFSLVIYGVGDMIGSGIYATVGKAAAGMGNAVWLSFTVSMVAAMLTGLSYASIASRYPRAAGACYVTHRAFNFSFLSYFIGLAVAASGLTSMATSTNAFSDVLAELLGIKGSIGKIAYKPMGWNVIDKDVGVLICILVFLAFMTLINFRGIRESMWTNLVCTAVEVGGLLFVVAVGIKYWGSVNYMEVPPQRAFGPVMLFGGAVLTFFAFVGFEDMLNVAEEVKKPERTMPLGIVLALSVVAVLYIAVSVTAVSVVHYTVLAAAPAPLSAITAHAAPWLPGWVFKFITMFSVANTVLINYIMGSRLLYGMSRQGLLPAMLGKIHHTRRTPHVAILTLLCIVIVLALAGGVADLATTTGLLLLGCFAVVNLALIVLKLRKGEPRGRFEVPIVIPALGIVINMTLIASRIDEFLHNRDVGGKPMIIAVGLSVLIVVLYLIMRPKAIPEEDEPTIQPVR
jgi:amino acid transporter